MSKDAPKSLRIDRFEDYEKKHVHAHGLRYTIIRSGVSAHLRLEARLAERDPGMSKVGLVQALAEKLKTVIGSCAKRTESIVNVCSICYDDVSDDVDAAKCDQNHAICSTCFASFVECELGKDIGLLHSSDAVIVCPSDKCEYRYTGKQISVCGNSILDKYAKVYRMLGERGALASIPAQSIPENSDARKKIEAALNLSCPHCRAAFAEYAGCDAVCCSRCNKFFCGLCLKACQGLSDAHQHAADCMRNNIGKTTYYSNQQLKEKVHQTIRKKKIATILNQYDGEKRIVVIENNKCLLKDYGY